jgi:cation diffusion facilitator family transporter
MTSPAPGSPLSRPEDGPHQAPALVAEKRSVAATSVVAAVFLTAFKLVVGLITGSLGVLAEAAHSLLDLVAAVMTLWAVRASAQPADGRHPYGHGKFENFSALVETALLLVTCVWILYEAVERLFFKHVEVQVTVWAFVVMAVSIVVDISRSRALRRVAKKSGSQALEADALHFSTDVWSSSVVILGLAAVWLAPRSGLPWLADADTVAAMLVALIVVWVSIQLGRKAVADLLDEAPAGMSEAVAAAVQLPGVAAVQRVRLRRSGPEAFADVTLAVEPGTSLERGHAIADAAETAVQAILPGADVVVHVEPNGKPEVPADETPAETVRRLAAEHGLPAHSIHLQSVMGRPTLELHVEVPGHLSVAQAHDRVSVLESEVKRSLPALAGVVTHIEPAYRPVASEDALPHGHFAELQAVHEVLAERRPLGVGHDVKLTQAGEGLVLSFHWTVAPDLAVALAHERTEEMERALRQRLPSLERIIIHVEPAEDREASRGGQPA